MMHKMNPQSVEQLRVPPHSIPAEQGVIGSVIQRNELIDNVIPVINADDFYNHAHQVIFKAVTEMAWANRAIDIVTLPDYLAFKNQLEEVGGETYIYEICRNVASIASLMTYANTVRNRSLQRQAIAAANDIQEQCYHSDGSNVIEILGNAEKMLGDVSEKLCSKEQDYSIHAAMGAAINLLEKRVESGKEIAGISTGLPDIDKSLNGLEPADMVVIAARPSQGKTTLAMNMVAAEATREGGRPVVFSMEMPREQLINKLMSSLGNIPLTALQRPADENEGMSDQYWHRTSEVMARMKETKLSIVDEAIMTIPRMRLELRRYAKQHGNPTLIMADYLQLIRGHTKTDNRTNEISEISRGIKALAKEFNCPFIVLSQLNRSLEQRSNKRPVNSDLRESGQIEQDADKIMFVYRDEVYNENTEDPGVAEIIIGKARMGKIGKVYTKFEGAYSRFSPIGDKRVVGETAQPKKFSERFEG